VVCYVTQPNIQVTTVKSQHKRKHLENMQICLQPKKPMPLASYLCISNTNM